MFHTSYDGQGNNYNDLLTSNRSLIVKLLMKSGYCTRSELAQKSGLSQAAITKITGSLIDMDIVEEIGLGKGEKGRRTIKLQLKSNKFFVTGAKITRKSFSTGIFDLAGNAYTTEEHTIYPHQSPESVLDNIVNIIKNYCKDNRNMIAVGISVPGPYLREKGIIAKMTEFSGWEKINLKDYFKKHLYIPVLIEHDANAGALAEWWFGNIRSTRLVHIIASEGIGSGIINNGHLLYGADGIAGEIGHMSIAYDGYCCQCGPESRGCLEQYCSSLSFLRDVKEQLYTNRGSKLHELKEFTVDDVFAAAKDGDEFARFMVCRVGFFFGIGIANVVYIYNPDTIIIGDIMSKAGDLMLNSIKETVKMRIDPELYRNLTICYSDLQCDASLLGAAATAVDYFLEKPTDFAMHWSAVGEPSG